ncbi:putative Sec1 [Giardia muris]|uniref:Putative Sec1 n=1 Tax=Giardia muris TaxID=5742 RepID=A0A4Z1SPW2_GIAMU|nr:putative Sec1 [Giardia muris]|eukprot:TNJ26915.1 putative Sec1 [Giardia muris]
MRDSRLVDLLAPTEGQTSAILVDGEGLQALNSFGTQTAVASKGVVLVSPLASAHQILGLDGILGIVYLSPSTTSLSQLYSLLPDSKLRMAFKALHISFTSPPNATDLQQLAEKDVGCLVKTVRVIPSAHKCLARNLAQTTTVTAPYDLKTLETQESRLFDLLLSLETKPFCVRYQARSSLARELAEAINRRIHARGSLFRYTEKGLAIPGQLPAGVVSKGKPVEVIVIDRRTDLVSALRQPWTFAALLQEYCDVVPSQDAFVDGSNVPQQYSYSSTPLFSETASVDYFLLTMSVIPSLRQALTEGQEGVDRASVSSVISGASELSERLQALSLPTLAHLDQALNNDSPSEAVQLIEKTFGTTKQRYPAILARIMELSGILPERRRLLLKQLMAGFAGSIFVTSLRYNVFIVPTAMKRLTSTVTRFDCFIQEAARELDGDLYGTDLAPYSRALHAFLTVYGQQLVKKYSFDWSDVEVAARQVTQREQGSGTDGASSMFQVLLDTHMQALDASIKGQIGANYVMKPRAVSLAEAAGSSSLSERDFPYTTGTQKAVVGEVRQTIADRLTLIYVIGGIAMGEQAGLDAFDYYAAFGTRQPILPFNQRGQQGKVRPRCGRWSGSDDIILASSKLISRRSLVDELVADINGPRALIS